MYGAYSGEGVYHAMQPLIQGMITEFDAKQQINRTPITPAEPLPPSLDPDPEPE